MAVMKLESLVRRGVRVAGVAGGVVLGLKRIGSALANAWSLRRRKRPKCCCRKQRRLMAAPFRTEPFSRTLAG